MSRASRKNAKRWIQFSLGATVVAVTVLLIVFTVKWITAPPQSPIPGPNTDTIVLSSGPLNSVTDKTTDSATDTDTDRITESSANATDSAQTTDTATTDSATDTNTATQTPSTNPSSVTPQNPTTDLPVVDSSDGVNADGTFDFTSWNLILVNPDHAIPDGFAPKLATVNLNGRERLVDSRTADAFRAMVLAAKADGITLYLRSTYRGIQLQTDSFNARVQQYINSGYSREDAIKKTATIIAVPGTSEHHTGLAADITTYGYDRLDQGFENTEAFRWLYTHCAEYGFILRYPKDKTDITRIIYEPWHYRYVGVQAAKIIMSEGICYEEFVAKYGNQ